MLAQRREPKRCNGSQLAVCGGRGCRAWNEAPARTSDNHIVFLYALFRAGVRVSAGTREDLAGSLGRRHERNGTRLPYVVGILDQAPDEVREALYAAWTSTPPTALTRARSPSAPPSPTPPPGIVAVLLADPRTGGNCPGNAPASRGETDPAEPPSGYQLGKQNTRSA